MTTHLSSVSVALPLSPSASAAAPFGPRRFCSRLPNKANQCLVADQCQQLLTLVGQTKHLPDVAGAGHGGALERRERHVAFEPLRECCPTFRAQFVECQPAKEGKQRNARATTVSGG